MQKSNELYQTDVQDMVIITLGLQDIINQALVEFEIQFIRTKMNFKWQRNEQFISKQQCLDPVSLIEKDIIVKY